MRIQVSDLSEPALLPPPSCSTTYLAQVPSTKSVTTREWRNWNPYFRTGTSFDGSFAATATNHYNDYVNLSSTRPYREVEYTPDPLSRITRETAPHTASAGPAATEFAYGVKVTDPRGLGTTYLVSTRGLVAERRWTEE